MDPGSSTDLWSTQGRELRASVHRWGRLRPQHSIIVTWGDPPWRRSVETEVGESQPPV